MDINLLPHVPTTKKYQWPIAIIAGVVVIVFGSFIGLQIWHKSSLLEENQLILERMKADREVKMGVLNKEKETSLLVETYLKDYQELLPTHVNWVDYVDEISRQLPSSGRIMRMAWSDEGIIEMQGIFPSIDLIGQYVQLLSKIEWVKNIDVPVIQESNASSQGVGYSGKLFTIKVTVNLDKLYMKEGINHE